MGLLFFPLLISAASCACGSRGLAAQLSGKSLPSEVGQAPKVTLQSAGWQLHPTSHSHPAVLGLHVGQEGEGDKNILQSRTTNKRTKFKKNKGGTKKSPHPDELLPLTARAPRAEAISFRLLHEQWDSKGWRERRCSRGLTWGPGCGGSAHPTGRGRQARGQPPRCPGAQGVSEKAEPCATGRGERSPTNCWPDSMLARTFWKAVWQEVLEAFDPECLIPEIYSKGRIRDSHTKVLFTGLCH